MPILTTAPVAKGTCNCGKCVVSERIPGGILKGHVACHCHACVKRAKKNIKSGESTDFGTLVPDWCCNVSLTGPTTSFISCGRLYCCNDGCCVPFGGGMINYQCAECEQTVCSYGIGLITGLAFPNAAIMNRALPRDEKTKPVWHQYYNSGIKPFGEDPSKKTAVPTYYDDIPSFLHIVFGVFGIGIPSNCANNCCCLPPPKNSLL
ncbi:hypothetical protein AB1Y20_008875 [Prymnesium parvum]|uniref:Uncharacterized protein n=1 Tax=Prymnesium parvum TaxID=97485 RepID=A0AB34IRS4_PRYPA|mmetsp:Transcript_36993/g.92045  ORF Transcript_36993/g.92045 Transcript_36993/m.92045 type:complete len:206 (-) Transcript_36993:320-937(-)